MKFKLWVLTISAMALLAACKKDEVSTPAKRHLSSLATGPDSTNTGNHSGDEEHPKPPPH